MLLPHSVRTLVVLQPSSTFAAYKDSAASGCQGVGTINCEKVCEACNRWGGGGSHSYPKCLEIDLLGLFIVLLAGNNFMGGLYCGGGMPREPLCETLCFLSF